MMGSLGNAKAEKSDIIEAAEKGEKVPIFGGHGDVNRMLKDKNLPELYEESDELKHKGLSPHDFSSISSNVAHKPKGFRMGFGDKAVR